jgi:type I restriction enzyme, S subunit
VPGHWEVVQFKQFVDIQNGSDHKHVEQAEGYPVLGSGGVFTYASEFLYDGESVLLGRKDTIDKPLHITGRFWTVDTMYWTKINPGVSGRFTYYSALTIPFDFYSTNTALPSMTKGALSGHRVAFPPLPEQTQIAAFLDRETAKIDALVAEQRRLMALLKEKRQAVISHAVTRGLNPDAPLKPSGIEWLGDVPEHWDVKKIKFVTANVKAGPFGSALTKDVYVSAGYRVYGQEQVIPNDFTLGDYFITPAKYDELSQYSVSPGDILISCVGTFGKIAIVPDNIEPGIINPRLIRLRCSHDVMAEYLVEVMRSNVTFEQFSSFTRGGTMDVINIGTLNEVYFALPPLAVQPELLSFIRREIAKFDTLTTEAQRAIDLLQERRTALISSAVTGQIDVRGAA